MPVARFDKILIANRGEIACRVIRTCRRLGLRTVAVFSDADAHALHVRLADEAFNIGPAPARESYLAIERILAAARRSGAQAIHPGYGFLSENEAFAAACAAAGVVFIGPPIEAIRAMGSKAAAKELMRKAAVPLVPGYHGGQQDAQFLQKEADRIGYPVLIKASAGGGGKGMRVVEQAADFVERLASCQREARASFGDDRVLVEKYVERPRHIEIQVFGDMHGNLVHMFDRDCSVQRRHQKVLEEAPAPGMTMERRAAMGRAAVEAARAVAYVGAGTVEFIVDVQGHFYFMEMNTRLQVEHPVTEMVTGLDLVEWQIRVAAGEALPKTQEELAIHGHALEARIYAEDADKGFLPSTGRLVHLSSPAPSAQVRIDTGVEQGDEITPHYDPMIAKLIVWDGSRELALRRMALALKQYRIVGVVSNVEFLQRLVASPAFALAELDTGLIERERDNLLPEGRDAPMEAWLLAALALVLRERQPAPAEGVDPWSPWNVRNGWRLNGTLRREISLQHGEREEHVAVDYLNGVLRMQLDEQSFEVCGELSDASSLQADIDGRRIEAAAIFSAGRLHLFVDGHGHVFTPVDPLEHAEQHGVEHGGLLSPMPGKIIALLVEPGASVAKGAPLLVLEAMKMEHTITAPRAGTVQRFHFAVGDQVREGAQLLEFSAD